MEEEIELILVPREFANDEHAILVAWTHPDGVQVVAGEKIAELEFSKSIVDLKSPRAGWLFHLHSSGTQIGVGEALAVISNTGHRPTIGRQPCVATIPDAKITAKAGKLMRQHNLSHQAFLGLSVVKEEHVTNYLAQHHSSITPSSKKSIDGELEPLSPIRARAAATLTKSKQTIPHSYLSRWLSADKSDQVVARLSEQYDMMVSLSDCLIVAVARAAKRVPRANASWTDDGVWKYSPVNVGFALNQANGDLLVPVLPDADLISVEDLVSNVRLLQKKALRQRLTPQDLSRGTVTVTSLLGTGVQQVLPILMPDQSTIVALADRVDAVPATYCLTVAFDHRVLNGSEAGEFLALVAEYLLGDGQ